MPRTSLNALDFIGACRFTVPAALICVVPWRSCGCTRWGAGLADAMNVALEVGYGTAGMFTTDRHYRVMRPLTGRPDFRLLPDDLRPALTVRIRFRVVARS